MNKMKELIITFSMAIVIILILTMFRLIVTDHSYEKEKTAILEPICDKECTNRNANGYYLNIMTLTEDSASCKCKYQLGNGTDYSWGSWFTVLADGTVYE